MNSISSIARSGMNTAMLGMEAAAHNISNLQTPGFRRQQVVQEAQAGGGVAATMAQLPQAGNSLVEDVVQQQVAGYAFKANLLTLKTEQQMLGSLLDLHA